MLLQRLATGATGVKQARYRRRPTRVAARDSYAHAQYIHYASDASVCICVAAVECETDEFRRTLVLFIQCMMRFAEYCQSNSANSEVRNIITSLYHATYSKLVLVRTRAGAVYRP